MLDLASIKKQFKQLVEQQLQWQEKQQLQLQTAYNTLSEQSSKWHGLQDKITNSKTSWLVAGLSDPPNKRYPLPDRPQQLNVLAADGSQIFPDRHQIAPCYLINIGLAAISYGTGHRPVMRNEPTLFTGNNPWGTEGGTGQDDVGIYRNLMELQALTKLGEETKNSDSPSICLSDGSLIWWFLDGRSQEVRNQFLEQGLAELDRFKQDQTPLAGYISHSGSSDVINALRIGLCPQEPVDCDKCPFEKNTLPCAAIEAVIDRTLFSKILQPGERSAIFKSSSKILCEYRKHFIYFFYFNTGHNEISRVEIPQWVVYNTYYLDLVHSAVYDQVQKGHGYPVVLREAHQQAVVKGTDRKLFYHLLESEFVRHNINIKTSRKSQTKSRVPI